MGLSVPYFYKVGYCGDIHDIFQDAMLRSGFISQIQKGLQQARICALLGPRQCGKTTLARQYLDQFPQEAHFFDLEDPDHLTALDQPKLAFSALNGLIVIDEIQRRPELFPLLRVMVDTYKKNFLILGSASQELIRQSSESLAGRIHYIEITPFSLNETGESNQLWFRGGYPLAYLAANDETCQNWLKDYTRTFLERDIPNLGFDLNPMLIRRFWMMLTGYHGNLFNASEIGRSLDLSHKTTKKYLDILTNTFIVRTLQPWFENTQKRQVKSTKIYFRDSGLLHVLLGISNINQLITHSKVGSSWEGFALEQVVRFHLADPQDCFFWATHSGAELDLLINRPGEKLAFEFKYSSTPKITRSMREAMNDLNLEKLFVIVPGKQEYRLAENIWVFGLESYMKI